MSNVVYLTTDCFIFLPIFNACLKGISRSIVKQFPKIGVEKNSMKKPNEQKKNEIVSSNIKSKCIPQILNI